MGMYYAIEFWFQLEQAIMNESHSIESQTE